MEGQLKRRRESLYNWENRNWFHCFQCRQGPQVGKINPCNIDLIDLGCTECMLKNCLKIISLKGCQIIWQRGTQSLGLALVLRDYLTQPFISQMGPLRLRRSKFTQNKNLKARNLVWYIPPDLFSPYYTSCLKFATACKKWESLHWEKDYSWS